MMTKLICATIASTLIAITMTGAARADDHRRSHGHGHGRHIHGHGHNHGSYQHNGYAHNQYRHGHGAGYNHVYTSDAHVACSLVIKQHGHEWRKVKVCQPVVLQLAPKPMAVPSGGVVGVPLAGLPVAAKPIAGGIGTTEEAMVIGGAAQTGAEMPAGAPTEPMLVEPAPAQPDVPLPAQPEAPESK